MFSEGNMFIYIPEPIMHAETSVFISPVDFNSEIKFGSDLPASFSQQVSSDNGSWHARSHTWEIHIGSWPRRLAGGQHTEADFRMSPSETQLKNDRFSGGQDNGSWTMLVFAVLWKFDILGDMTGSRR